MSVRDPRVKLLEERRRRSRDQVAAIQAFGTERVDACDLCGETQVTLVAERDRYGIAVRSGACPTCGLVYLVDRLSEKGYAEFYARHYRPLVSAYFGRVIDAVTVQREQRLYAAQLASLLAPWLDRARPRTILDVGGSTGVIADALVALTDAQATILDPADDEIAVARSKGYETIPSLLERWRPEGRTFDLLVMAQTIDHLVHLRDGLRSLRSVVAPGGFMFCDIVDLQSVCQQVGSIEGALHIDHCYYLRQETAPRIFAAMGWEVVMADVASRPGHVGYLLSPGPDAPIAGPVPDHATFVRSLQSRQIEWAEASRKTYGPVHWTRQKAYRALARVKGR